MLPSAFSKAPIVLVSNSSSALPSNRSSFYKLVTANHLLPAVAEKEALIRQRLQHLAIRNIHGRGLLLAVEFESADLCQRICHAAVQAGLITETAERTAADVIAAARSEATRIVEDARISAVYGDEFAPFVET